MKQAIYISFLCFSIIAILLFSFLLIKKINKKGKPFIYLLTVLMSYDLLINMYVELDLWALFPELLFTNWSLPFAYGPLFYLFILTYTSETKPRWFHFFYFSPFIYIQIINFRTFFSNGQHKYDLFQQMANYDFSYITNDKEWIFQSVLNTLFVILSFKVITIQNLVKYKSIKWNVLGIICLMVLQLIYLIIYFNFEISYLQHNLYIIILWILVILLSAFTLNSNKKPNNSLLK